MDAQLYGQLIFGKAGKNTQREKDSLFNKWCWEIWTATCKRIKPDHFLTPHTKINSKWIKDLNGRPEALKILKESIDSNFSDINQNNNFLDRSLKASETKTNINYWDYIRIKSFCTVKETTKLKGNLQNERRYLQMTYLRKG